MKLLPLTALALIAAAPAAAQTSPAPAAQDGEPTNAKRSIWTLDVTGVGSLTRSE